MEYTYSSNYALNNHQVSPGVQTSYSAPSCGKTALQRHPASPPVRLRDTERVDHVQQHSQQPQWRDYEGFTKHQLKRFPSCESSKDSGMGSYTQAFPRKLESDVTLNKLYHRGWSPDRNNEGYHGYRNDGCHGDPPREAKSPKDCHVSHHPQRNRQFNHHTTEDRRYNYDAGVYNTHTAHTNAHHAHLNRNGDVVRRLASEFQKERDLSPVSTSSSHSAALGITVMSGSSDNLSVASSRSRDDLDLSLEHEARCKTSSPRSETHYPHTTHHHKTNKSSLAGQKMYKSTPDLSAKHLKQHQQNYPPYNRTNSQEEQQGNEKSHRPHHRRKNSAKSEGAIEQCDLREPLNSTRLRPIRQKTRNAVVNIMSDGDVCLEFIKRKESEERVVEVFRISPDGTSVRIYTPSGEKGGVTVSDRPPPPQPDGKGLKHYMFHNLPDKYWKRYQYATRFVQLVRSKTPKVTLYTPTAKAMLMENSPDPDFEVTFFEGGKFSHSGEGTRIIRKDGTSLMLDGTTSVQTLAPEMQKLWNYVTECRQRCEDIEKLLTSIESSSSYSYFPVTLGRRPHSDHSSVPSPAADTPFDQKNYTTPKNRQSFETEPSPASMRSFEGTIMSQTTFTGSYQSATKVSAHSAHSAQSAGSRSPPGSTHSHQGSSSHHRSVISNHHRRAASVISNQTPTQNSEAPSSHTITQIMPQHHAPSGGHLPHQSPPGGHVQQQQPPVPVGSIVNLPAVLCRAFVPGIGWATQFANGEIAVNFNDGSELSIQSSPMLVRHTDPDGTLSRFRGSDQLPGSVRSKLARLPDVMSKLELASSKDFSPQMAH